MTFWLLAAMVTLSALAAAFGAASIAAAAVLPALRRGADRWAPARRAAVLFHLRTAPLAAASVFAVLVVLPTFLYYEPIDTDEPVTVTLVIGAFAGLLIAATSAVRAWRAWRATAELSSTWIRTGRRIESVEAPVPVVAVRQAFPTVAVVGWRHPVLGISEDVLCQCDPDEIRAMVAHECAHIRAHDNLRRLALRACPPAPFARGLAHAWEIASEQAADASAAQSGVERLDIAQALVTMARLASHARLELPGSAFFEGGAVESRVRLLLEPIESAGLPPGHPGLLLAAIALCGASAVFFAPFLHQGMELLVRLLP